MKLTITEILIILDTLASSLKIRGSAGVFGFTELSRTGVLNHMFEQLDIQQLDINVDARINTMKES